MLMLSQLIEIFDTGLKNVMLSLTVLVTLIVNIIGIVMVVAGGVVALFGIGTLLGNYAAVIFFAGIALEFILIPITLVVVIQLPFDIFKLINAIQ